MKILNIVGTRPNFIKIAPIIEQMDQSAKISYALIHTGQHHDENMNQTFFNQLNIPSPDVNLGVRGGSNIQQVSQILQKFEPVLLRERPHAVLVVGDVNSTLACAMVAAYHGIKVVHVEAGLRSFDLSMPEEINRILTDKISDLLFVTEASGMKNLAREGIDPQKTHFVGNVMVDTLLKYQDFAANSSEILNAHDLKSKQYIVLTLHRPSNVDRKEVLQGILEAMVGLAQELSVVFSIHPRTEKKIKEFHLSHLIENLILIPPVPYLDMLQLMSNSKLVLTDSGGIQEETTILKVPCLTLRENTERPVTIEKGTNVLAGTKRDDILNAATQILACENKKGSCPELWDGFAAKRIVEILEDWEPSCP
ncbi:MAG: UDP-N-acetylglucosamine 2-epimerase (non-hydrolyzing) [Nitrospina sp.]|jgi:UDP-N-acetylglucosamine 2-epimerase (non-hydrolysing)|nr:UDP-N-acetylglucosamine 2-epimerase (non-hydrolyzing) [Nitrospina sp.]MBT4048846.1 UDP-N-acetylglucosamine 2-epimerase (non-hydrolyzing) [Nitrospina sp.]MBT4390858.1 UDP-N-acetylglucosamine 2-epimerase (non-hydrolyzing) [Nitrospina sp.]MBT4556909.1 UDP-N-acetylglucosamine 2-epimerase (non-hydrolyzing) [Nitrospina sp.]MBT6741165.1 UDP-N-acetylglucosamine 2-epimerase (non-hydrolyzing) [Nitrospina sp.]